MDEEERKKIINCIVNIEDKMNSIKLEVFPPSAIFAIRPMDFETE